MCAACTLDCTHYPLVLRHSSTHCQIVNTTNYCGTQRVFRPCHTLAALEHLPGQRSERRGHAGFMGPKGKEFVWGGHSGASNKSLAPSFPHAGLKSSLPAGCTLLWNNNANPSARMAQLCLPQPPTHPLFSLSNEAGNQFDSPFSNAAARLTDTDIFPLLSV